MNINTLLQLATLISVLVGVIGLLINSRGYQRQVTSQFLLEYTRRVDDIMQSLPLRVWAPHLSPNEKPPEPSEQLTLGILRCLNYVSQLHYLCHNGYLPKSMWRLRQHMYVEILRTPLFVREWKRLGHIFVNEKAFCKFVEASQSRHIPESDIEEESTEQN